MNNPSVTVNARVSVRNLAAISKFFRETNISPKTRSGLIASAVDTIVYVFKLQAPSPEEAILELSRYDINVTKRIASQLSGDESIKTEIDKFMQDFKSRKQETEVTEEG